MVFDLLIVASVAGAIWWWQTRRPRQARHAREDVQLLPYEDLPPIGAFAPLPVEAEFDDYIAEGLERIDGFLAGRDQTA